MEINLNALRHNLRTIRQHLPKEVNVLAVVKANAYGHGAVETLRIALKEGFTAAAVARAPPRRLYLPHLRAGPSPSGRHAHGREI